MAGKAGGWDWLQVVLRRDPLENRVRDIFVGRTGQGWFRVVYPLENRVRDFFVE
jgi:hypothetical protein